MEKGDDKIHEDLAVIQKTIESATGKVAHHTKAEREKLARKILREGCSRNKPGKHGRNNQ